ncbi:ion transporter [Oceanospirillum sanctuarii]|uniref:ion transporter n=1 Tax=Oceanospirillum sanctuarii TaxID=1434821 RepID=UPI0015937EBF|nr:ion transporter [Oceanospirillum sanctuarii]
MFAKEVPPTEAEENRDSIFFRIFLNERITGLVILGSVLLSFFSHHWSAYANLVFEWYVVSYFFFEFIAKARRLGLNSYFSLRANKFDFTVLGLSILLLITPAFTFGSMTYLRALRLVTMLRAFRLVPNAHQIIQGLGRALSAARAVLLFMFIMMVVFAITGYSLFSPYLPEYFGTPLTALNTVFGIFTIENWGAIPESALQSDLPWLFYAVNSYVILVLVLGGFIALSLANAIFVDEMVSDNNDDLMREVELLKQQNESIIELLKHHQLGVKGTGAVHGKE